MFRKRLWAFQETLKPLEGHAVRLLERTEAYCTVREVIQVIDLLDFTDCLANRN